MLKREGTAKELGLDPAHLGHMRRRGLAEIVHAPPGGMAKTWRIVEPERTIGTLIRQKRMAAGLSLDDVADIAGICVGAVGRLERDKCSMKHATMHSVLVALNLRYAELFAELEDKPAPERLPAKGRMSYPMAVEALMNDWTGYVKARQGQHVNWRILRQRVEERRLDWIAYCQQLDALIGGWR